MASSMPAALWCLSVQTTPEGEDIVQEALSRLSGSPPVITHSFESGKTTIAAYVADHRFWTAARHLELKDDLRAALPDGARRAFRIRWRLVPPEDWAESWKRHFPPFSVGRRLLVRPSWSRRRPARGQAEIVINPGLSFGTGQHPTTAYCLAEVVRLAPRGNARCLLDAGTGSGILALAAARLGYAPVDAFDSDASAIDVARRNGILNKLAKQVRWRRADLRSLASRRPRRFDVVCANLTANLLVEHATSLLERTTPGGHLVLAGILAEEFALVGSCFLSLGAALERERRVREWHSATFQWQKGVSGD